MKASLPCKARVVAHAHAHACFVSVFPPSPASVQHPLDTLASACLELCQPAAELVARGRCRRCAGPGRARPAAAPRCAARAAAPAAAIARTSWVCGEHGNNMVKLVLRLAADPDQALAFVDDQRGKPTFTADLLARLGMDVVTGGAPGRYPPVDLATVDDLGTADLALLPEGVGLVVQARLCDLRRRGGAAGRGRDRRPHRHRSSRGAPTCAPRWAVPWPDRRAAARRMPRGRPLPDKGRSGPSHH